MTAHGGSTAAKPVQDVAAGVAQELRGAVFAISSAAQLLRYRIGDDPVVETNVGRILREVEKLNALVAALMDYGRPDPPRLARVDPDEIWSRTLEAHRGALETKSLVVRRTPATPRATCRLDADQTAHAFAQLLTNAIEAAPEASDLTLTSRLLPDGSWHSSLHNGGAAVATDFVPRAFHPLTTTKPGHVGIGLAVAQRIVAAQSGSLTLESGDSGTAVAVVFPPSRG